MYTGIGIVLLIVLICFKSLTNKIEQNNSIDLLIPLTTKDSLENKNTIVVKINKDLKVYVDEKEHNIEDLEKVLLAKVLNDSLTIVLRAEKSVPVENVVKVMDIANRNKLKVIMSVRQNN